ncbi:hypothetical protein K7W42_07805 [Deinococcus sp. HMF7604]|uniref:hypothetical protein n=1 Tax=Deinococcus betulae TaxID=2873312 RepID=UPI001CC934A7|nr:hypothetical protein [Deinococcus betulae]MBZ9750764.1 hypothetical protein [Deinococcus betulae]
MLLSSGFSAFWILAILYTQLIDRKRAALQVFPQGLNDAAALIPLTVAAFAALLFNAQQSVSTGSKRHLWYGRAGRCLLAAFYFFGASFIAGIGSRLMDADTFDGWRMGWLLNLLAQITPGMAFIEAMLACAALVMGIWYYTRTMFSRE